MTLSVRRVNATGPATASQDGRAARIEAYVVRRAICSIPPNSLNKIFANLNKDRYLESIQAHLLLFLQSNQRFPSDDEFRRAIQTRDVYHFPRRSYLLRRLENHGRKEFAAVEDYTIVHILPQNENLSAKWREALGPEWERIQTEWLHTLGNLTLTGYNSDYSDQSFTEKRDMKDKGFKASPLKLNAGLGGPEQWNEDTIKSRGSRRANMAVEVWSAPKLPDDVRAAFRPKPRAAATYTIEKHKHLQSGAVRALFDAFRKEVLALDPQWRRPAGSSPRDSANP